jgi:predicted dehydrogenase
MSRRKEVNVLLVGAGVRGRDWAKVCSDEPQVELVGILDRDTSRAEAVREELDEARPVIYRDMSAALREGSPDAVIISTPPDSHHSLVSNAISQGKHVLCEKPLSDDVDDVIDLVGRARDKGVILMVGMNFRYLSTSQRIRQTVQNRRLGDLSYAQFSYVRHRDGNRDDLNDYPMTMPYPMLLEQSIHHFDLLRYCYGTEVASLVADSWRPTWSTYDNDCCVSVLFRFANGLRANYLGTWTAAWNKMTFNWRSEFSSGVLIQQSQFDDLVRVEFEPELALTGARFKTAEESEPMVTEELEPCVPFVDDSRGLLAELIASIHGDVEPTTTGVDHLRSLCLVWACIESLETRRWVDLSDFYDKLGLPPAMLGSQP